MASTFDLSGLKRFKEKVESKKLMFSNMKNILNALCEAGVKYAQSLYGGTASVELEYVVLDNVGVITAKGEHIAYLEYGTGEKGRGTYSGNLPEQNISFFSNRLNQQVNLNGWTYSYAHEIDENVPQWNGFSAQAQMWKTAQYLRNNASKIIREVVGE